jgi:hypothetical protein
MLDLSRQSHISVHHILSPKLKLILLEKEIFSHIKGTRKFMSPIPSQRDYEMRELSMFRKQMEQVERLPLAERKENAREWLNDLMNDQKLIAERVGWLLNGSYGKGSFDSACRVLASPRMNQVAWCAITIANLEWRCPAKMAIESWKKLPVETRYQVNEAIRREIADAKAEGYCG